MSININIESELWDSCKKNYGEENYKNAIVDATLFLTNTIRDKTGLELDGVALIGQAFGGIDPKIQVSKLQTDSEKEMQKGIQDILRGIYIGIRNPRMHDTLTDTKNDADAIISFIDYLLRIIDKSRLNFDENSFLDRIFDHDYVKTKEYSELLVGEIPTRKKSDIAISIFNRREIQYASSLTFFMSSLLARMDDEEIKRLYRVISDEMKTVSNYHKVCSMMLICPGEYLEKIDLAVRLRFENLILKDMKLGRYFDHIIQEGDYGSLASQLPFEYFKRFDKHEWTNECISKLESRVESEIKYVGVT